jgi:tetratricopeptide (TPR) repeat protein
LGYLSPSEGISKAYAAIMTAQKLDSNLAEVHFLLGAYKLWTHWDWKGCESEYQKAFKFNPNNAEVPAIYSHLLNILGRPKEAMEQIEMALNLNPFDPMIKGLYSIDLLFMHRYKDAIAVSREALKIEPTNSPALTALMLSLHMTGRYDEALELWKTTYYISYPSFIHAFDQGYAKAGYIGALSLEADALVAQSKTSNVGPWDLANLYVCAGNKKRALDYLELGFKKHDQNLIYLTEPIFDCLHNETRYQALCRKMNLPIK